MNLVGSDAKNITRKHHITDTRHSSDAILLKPAISAKDRSTKKVLRNGPLHEYVWFVFST